MYLKKIHATPPDWVRQTNEAGDCTNPPPVDYVSIGHTGIHARQSFSVRVIAKGVQEGWLRMDPAAQTITLKSHPDELVYDILRVPGRYCTHCQQKLPDDAGGEMARLHVAAEHAGQTSPDPENPSGYAMRNDYLCELRAELHAKHNARARGPHVTFPRKEP